MYRINRVSFKPVYLQISDLIREDIENGKLKPGDRIWSERFIMEEFNVSRNTAQRAIEELFHDGLVARIQGKGTFITKPKVSYGLQRLTSFSEEMRFLGKQPTSQLLSLTKMLPPSSMAQKLHLQTTDEIYQLERIRFADDLPMAHQVSCMPEFLCPGLEKYDFTRESLYFVLESHYNLRLSWEKQVVKPVIAHQEEAKLLLIKSGMPLLLVEGVAYLEDNTPVEAKRILYRSDVYEFTVHSGRIRDSV